MLGEVVSFEHGRDPMVSLRPMTGSEFETWREIAIAQHAAQMSRATGRGLEVSLDEAGQLLLAVLVDGLNTKAMSFFAIEASDRRVGWLWIGSSPRDTRAGYVWDIIIDDACRGRGYGRAAMVAAEGFFEQQGRDRIDLQVAAGNDVARRLYESLGYADVVPSDVMTTMSKTLGPTARSH
jgi:ribosomal protein S18 acetylase RimI-like enzyme